MAYAEDIQQFLDQLDAAVDDVMEHDEVDMIKGIMPIFVQFYVFDKYAPRAYERAEERGAFGGLTDPRIYKDRYDRFTKTLEVEIDRQDSDFEEDRWGGHYPGKEIADIVESGTGYRWPSRVSPHIPPRPFAEEAEKDMALTGKFEGHLIDGLRKNGFQADWGATMESYFESAGDSVYGELPD